MNPIDTTYTRYLHAKQRDTKDALFTSLLWQIYNQLDTDLSWFENMGNALAVGKIKEICTITENRAEAVQMIRAYFSGPGAGVATPEFLNATFLEQWEQTHTI